MNENFTTEQLMKIRDDLAQTIKEYAEKGLEIDINTSLKQGRTQVEVANRKEKISIVRDFSPLKSDDEKTENTSRTLEGIIGGIMRK